MEKVGTGGTGVVNDQQEVLLCHIVNCDIELAEMEEVLNGAEVILMALNVDKRDG